MSVQTTYSDTPAIAFAGMLAEQFSLRQIDSGIAEGALALGQAVKDGSSDAQYVPAAADDAVTGIAVFSSDIEQDDAGAVTYADKAQVPVLKLGRYYATANGALAKGASVAYDPNDGKVGAVVGATTTLAFGKAVTASAADGDLIIVELNLLA